MCLVDGELQRCVDTYAHRSLKNKYGNKLTTYQSQNNQKKVLEYERKRDEQNEMIQYWSQFTNDINSFRCILETVLITFSSKFAIDATIQYLYSGDTQKVSESISIIMAIFSSKTNGNDNKLEKKYKKKLEEFIETDSANERFDILVVSANYSAY